MKLPEFSVNRPVTTSMFYLGVLMLGFISLTQLPRELFPSITYPQLTVVTTYENAAPEEVETLITKIVEEAVGTVSRLKGISSISKEGVSIVTTEFNWGTDMDFASLGVREKIDLIKERLPLGSADPIVMKFNPFELPVMTLSITGDKLPSELLRLSRKFIKEELEKVEGVASSNISGGLEREILVSVDSGRLFASNISITKVVDALKTSNVNYPAGTIEEHFYEYLIRTMGEFGIVPDIQETIVGKDKLDEERPLGPERPGAQKTEREARLIYLKDIASIKDTFQERTSISRYNGSENISIAVQKQAGVNTLRVAQNVRDRLRDIKKELPYGMNVDLVYDQSIFIKEAIDGVMQAAIIGGFLAFLVLLVFLRKLKPALIVAFSMPISIMVAFNLMYFNGISLNMLSLGGLALGIGMLVDNGIVVIENIYNHLKTKKDIREASSTGASEMSGAIFSSTLTTVAVFLPMMFVVGVAGQLFKELAFTVTFSLLASLLVALSLIPRMAASGRRRNKTVVEPTKVSNDVSSGRLGLGGLYSSLLPKVLRHKWIFLAGAFLIFLLSLNLVKVIDKEFMPKIDQREFIMKVNMPSGTKLQVTNKIVKKIENILLDTKEINGVTVSIGSSKKKDYAQGLETMGSHQSQIIITLKKGKKWAATSSVIEKLKDHLDQLDLQAAEIEYVLQESVFKSALQGSAPIVIEVKGKDLDKIEKIALEVKEGLSKVQGIYGVRTSLTSPAPETKVNIIKDKAALYNLSTAVIAETAHTALKGVVATKFKEEGMEIDIRVRLRKEDREYLSHVRTLWIYSPLNIEVPLSEVAYITHGMGPSEIKRLDQQRVVLVTANIAGRALDKVINNINTLVEGIESNLVEDFQGLQGIEKDVTIDLSGESQQMNESFTSLGFALLLSIILVYMIMAAQFESLSQPFIIMFTLPLSMMGVLIALYITHTPISVVVMLGLIILGGIVVNNGIILIDSINRLRLNGVELIKAVIDSSRTRLRPIFMTTMTTVLGLFPLALGIAEGSQLQSPMAITVMGGLLVSTVFTLFVIPCVYVIAAELIPGGFAVKLESKKIKKEKIVKLEAPSEKKVIVLPSPPPPAPPRAPSPPEVPAPPESPALPPSSPAASKPAPSPPAPTPVPPEDLKDKEKEAELLSLNKRQRKILERLKELKRITRQEYAEFFDISVPTAARDLKELVNKEYLIAQGPFGPGRWYELK